MALANMANVIMFCVSFRLSHFSIAESDMILLYPCDCQLGAVGGVVYPEHDAND